ncbi:hypothetical protein GOBAR_AA24075 [Gossypium barbadense]|uniref:Uncharacterized protein n=1 Tax=Gossypium barbadense TaxID=3634 RepID=A0A2P5WZS4_GOSBA|nr:hypothetical protein GOBAR_AA24075 [Gossypium barbadense]
MAILKHLDQSKTSRAPLLFPNQRETTQRTSFHFGLAKVTGALKDVAQCEFQEWLLAHRYIDAQRLFQPAATDRSA